MQKRTYFRKSEPGHNFSRGTGKWGLCRFLGRFWPIFAKFGKFLNFGLKWRKIEFLVTGATCSPPERNFGPFNDSSPVLTSKMCSEHQINPNNWVFYEFLANFMTKLVCIVFKHKIDHKKAKNWSNLVKKWSKMTLFSHEGQNPPKPSLLNVREYRGSDLRDLFGFESPIFSRMQKPPFFQKSEDRYPTKGLNKKALTSDPPPSKMKNKRVL